MGQRTALLVSLPNGFLQGSDLALDNGTLGLEIALAIPVRPGRLVPVVSLSPQIERLVAGHPLGFRIAVRCRLGAFPRFENPFLLQPRTEVAGVTEVHVDASHLSPLGLGTFVVCRSPFFGLECRLPGLRGVGRQGLLSFAHRRGASVERRLEVRAHALQGIATRLEVGVLRIDRFSKRLAARAVVEDLPHQHRTLEKAGSRLRLRQLFLAGLGQCLAGLVSSPSHLDQCGSELDSRLPARILGLTCRGLV